ncbi:MAG TPA: hypothetical protein PLH46_06000 [Caldisericia bacterium]|nr:hypothetical protein [Caldisericia bacterium]
MKIVEIIQTKEIGLTDGKYDEENPLLNVFTKNGYKKVTLKEIVFIDWLEDLTKDELKQYKKLNKLLRK